MRDRTALVIEVPEAEPAVHPFRDRHDPSASMGMPAHITVLFPLGPFAAVRDTARAVCADHAAPAFTLARIDTFDRDVIWLAPEPNESLRSLIAATTVAFPDYPPYSGTITEPVPHLTVAHCTATTFADALEEVRTAIDPLLPISVRVDTASLFGETDDGRWVALERFGFAAASVGS